MSDLLLPGIVATRVPTGRLTQGVLHPEGVDLKGGGEAVLFVHGGVSSSLFWQQALLDVHGTGRYRALAVDLRGFGDTDPLPIDATRGMRDWSDDVAALVDTLSLDRVHLVGWSMGGGVVLQYLLDAPERVASVALSAPISPYGMGGTAGADGKLIHPDGVGAGAVDVPDFIAAVEAGDASAENPAGPRTLLRSNYFSPGSLPLDPHLEDIYVASMLTTRTGPDHYPGEVVTTDVWPGVAPGKRGVSNTMAPTVHNVSGIVDLPQKPPVLWVRGDADQVISDASIFDFAHLGAIGAVPGWPGADAFPTQPMVTQTRAVLDRYAAAGGFYREVVLPGVAHSPHVERPQEFAAALLEHLDTTAEAPSGSA